jgi:hypothetical protein
MYGQKRNLILLSSYLVLATILIVTLFYFIWQSGEKEINQNFTISQVEKYYISATVSQVHISARAVVVDYQTEVGIMVGLLPEANIINQANQEISLVDLQEGQKVKIEVKFIGTNSILAGNIYLEN